VSYHLYPCSDIDGHIIAFIKEHIHNAVEINNLGIFGRVFIVTNLPPPPPEKLFRDCGLALTHIPMWKQKTLPSSRLREVGSICELLATRPVEKIST